MAIDFSTTYMGLTLRNPLVASSSPLSHKVDTICKLEEAGIGAVVMYSLFEEQITLESQQLDYFLTHGTESYAEALSYFPDVGNYNVGPDEYLNLIRKAKETVDIPIIGSLNGVSAGGWVRYAKLIQEAGADGLELNVYYLPTDPDLPGAAVEDMTVDVVKAVRNEVNIPLAVKIGPFFSSIPHMAKRLAEAGADALVLFNRFYQPDIDIENLEVTPHLVLSTSDELRLPLRWTAILYGRVPVDLAITTGVHTYRDVLKGLMAGAKVTMMASELLQNGLGRIGQILQEMESWMMEYEYSSVQQMIGSVSQKNVAEPAAFERANYMKVLDSYPRMP
ncbi:MAG: dihydroorotate dehydrogenase-like protein [bacterium]|nr:dihydroorotate dehydrogenase-like protein [bacterium]MCS7309781.1 dihydroorotate dehydrogenase-like protein [Armatimonadota bacterium]